MSEKAALIAIGVESLTKGSDAESHRKLDAIEALLLSLGAPVELPLNHHFVPGVYAREMHAQAGTIATSKVHKTRHLYVILKGSFRVFIPGVGFKDIEAGHIGVTEPGTRRLVLFHEDTVWVTFHANPDDETDVDEIERRIIEKRERADCLDVHAEWRAQVDERRLAEADVREVLL